MTPAEVPDELHDLAMAAYYADIEYSLVIDCVDRALAAVLPEHERRIREQVSAEILAERDSLPVTTIDEQIFQTGMVLAARVARVGPTRAPQGTGDAHTPEHGHGEGSDDSEASQRRSGAGGGEA